MVRAHSGLREQADGALELNERSLRVQSGRRGPLHATNEDRDRDGSKVCKIHIESLLTPQIFAETMANRVYNTSTATIEEVEPEPEPRVTAAPSIEGAREHTSACVHGPSSTPAH